jgi:hypothetical protein
MPGVMSDDLKQAAPIGANIVDRNANKRIGAWQCLGSKKREDIAAPGVNADLDTTEEALVVDGGQYRIA